MTFPKKIVFYAKMATLVGLIYIFLEISGFFLRKTTYEKGYHHRG